MRGRNATAHYTATIHTPWPAAHAFEYMADLRNFEKWDPGVTHSRMVEGTEPGADAAYLVKVQGAVLRYETKEFLPHSRTVVEAVSKLLRSYDIIEVEPSGDGCDVLYDASGCASPTTPCPMPTV